MNDSDVFKGIVFQSVVDVLSSMVRQAHIRLAKNQHRAGDLVALLRTTVCHINQNVKLIVLGLEKNCV
jgi:hypothetical protein